MMYEFGTFFGGNLDASPKIVLDFGMLGQAYVTIGWFTCNNVFFWGRENLKLLKEREYEKTMTIVFWIKKIDITLFIFFPNA